MPGEAKTLTFSYALRSFRGYLEGSGKSANTIRNYLSDLNAFSEFLNHGLATKPVSLQMLTLQDLETYNEFLKKEGFKTNTRRRKILTVRKLLRYLKGRKKVSIDIDRKIPTPYKVERVPKTFAREELLDALNRLPRDSELRARNHLLLWTLMETGCLVSELCKIRGEDFGEGVLHVSGKAERKIPVPKTLSSRARELQAGTGRDLSEPLFRGFNKFGPLGSTITPRGVELLVSGLGRQLELTGLSPRALRHSAARHWLEAGLSQEEVQRRLGLRTGYAFRAYSAFVREAAKNP